MKLSRIAGFIALITLLGLTLLGATRLRKAETPPWRSEPSEIPHTPPLAKQAHPSEEPDFPPFHLVTYNVKNWLTSGQNPPKSPEAKSAVIQILATASPDILGLCEIGNIDDVEEIQSLLAAEGIHLPHSHLTGGEDPVRHLAILSRFPILSTASPDTSIPGSTRSMQRGILDVTLNTGGKEIRLIGLHLKSKRNVTEFDQAALRLAEAAHVRTYADSILTANPKTHLIIYGDFNDTTRSLSTKTIYGTYRSPLYMNPIHVADSRGESWTHFYARQDAYTRIDFVTVSQALLRHVDKQASSIIDHPLWETASDHRPVLIRFR